MKKIPAMPDKKKMVPAKSEKTPSTGPRSRERSRTKYRS